MDANGIIIDQAELVRHFGISDRTLRRWKKSGMPVMPDGRFDILSIAAWRKVRQGISISSASNIQNSTDQSNELGKDHWEMRNKRAQAEARELELRKRRGELVEVSRVEELFIRRIGAVKQGLLALPVLLPPDLVYCRSEREMFPIIDKAVRSLLKEFARPLPSTIIPTNTSGSEAEDDRHDA